MERGTREVCCKVGRQREKEIKRRERKEMGGTREVL